MSEPTTPAADPTCSFCGLSDCPVYVNAELRAELVEEFAELMGRMEVARVRYSLTQSLDSQAEQEVFVHGARRVIGFGAPEDLEQLQALQRRLFPFRGCWRSLESRR